MSAQIFMIPGIKRKQSILAISYIIAFSEKQRIPGWTDRILFKGEQLKQIQYNRAELYTSDHRPGNL
jgi:hypothetical protein